MRPSYSEASESYLTRSSPALTANSRLGWRGLPGTNTLAYCEHSRITSVKSFVSLDPDGEEIEMKESPKKRSLKY